MHDKHIRILAVVATIAAICMYSDTPKVSDKARRRRQYAFVRRGDATPYEAFGGLLYTSYIFQIQENLAGHKASPIQPLCAAINCTLWVIYGLFKTPRDLPVAIANAPGVVLGIITCITSL